MYLSKIFVIVITSGLFFSSSTPNSSGKSIQRPENKAVTQGAWLPEAPRLQVWGDLSFVQEA